MTIDATTSVMGRRGGIEDGDQEGEELVVQVGPEATGRDVATPASPAEREIARRSRGFTVFVQPKEATSSGRVVSPPNLRAIGTPRAIPPGYDGIVEERTTLIRRKYASGLSAAETRRLRYLDWLVNVVESSRLAPDLGRLESLLRRVERLAQRVREDVDTYKARVPEAFMPRRADGR